MGINSTEVSYGFGQMGSMLVDGTDAFYPPKGYVIVAITALTDTVFNATNGLISELDGDGNSPWISTDADAHGTGIIAATTGHNNNGNADHDTGEITLGAASTKIKKGMIVESATLCPRSLTDPFVVLSHDGTTTAQGLIIAKQSSPNVAVDHAGNVASGAAEALYILENHGGQGRGGVEMDASNTIPKGVTIYGRWTAVTLNTGKAICYVAPASGAHPGLNSQAS